MKPKNKKRYIFAYVTPELHQEVREYCAKNRISLVELMTKLLEKKINKGVTK